jgi:hypothetical protein
LEASLDALLERMGSLLTPMVEQGDERRHFLAVYMRTAAAVDDEIRTAREGGFADPAWMRRWLLAFASLYVEALECWNREGSAPGPWQIVFAQTGRRVPPLRQVLVGTSAHVNYDLPQALLEVTPAEDFDDPGLIGDKRKDHEHLDRLFARRAAEEDRLLREAERWRDRSITERALSPFGGPATVRFLKDARERVWRNATVMSRALREGPAALKARVDELGELSSARAAYLSRPGVTILRAAKDAPQVLLEGA